MDKIKIYDANDNIITEIVVSESCKRSRELMVSDYVELSWESNSYVKFGAGCHIYYGTQTVETDNPAFYLLNPYEPTHRSETVYTYTPQFHARQQMWQKYPACIYSTINGVTCRELEWSFLGTPQDALYIIEQSVLNETGFALNTSYISSVKEQGSTAVELSCKSESIFNVLKQIVTQLDAEWWYDEGNNRVCVGECRLDTNLYPIITFNVGTDCENPQVNQNADDYYFRYYCFGSEKNIAQQEITAITNSVVKKRLPLDSTKYPDGFMDLDILQRPDLQGDSTNGFYLPSGTVYQPTVTDKSRIFPKGLYFDDVYPSTKFYVKSILVNGIDGRQKLIDENGNEVGDTYYVALSLTSGGSIWNGYTLENVLPNETLEMYFTSGILQGRQFALSAHIKYDGTNTYFYLTPNQNGALTVPNQYMCPAVGDEVTFFGYDFGQTGIQQAKERLEKTATKYLYDLVQQNTVYTFKGNTVAFVRKASTDVRFSLMPIGQQLVIVYNNSEQTTTLRVTKVESAIDIPEEMTITANAKTDKTGGTITQLYATIESNARTTAQQITSAERAAKNFAQRGFDQIKETLSDVQEYFSDTFSEAISPVTVQTMQAVVGSEELQFVFGENVNFSTGYVTPDCSYNKSLQRFQVKMWNNDNTWFYIKHITLGITDLSTGNATDALRKIWKMKNAYTTWQNDDDGRFMYLKCPKSTTKANPATATLYVSKVKIALESGDYYYLLLGFLNKPDLNGDRSFAQMYGYSEILPGRVTTDRIVSADGQTYIDLTTGEISSNKAISFKYNGAQADLAQTIAGVASTASSAESTANTASSTASEAQQATVQKYGVCGTAQGTAAKAVTLTTGTLKSLAAGVIVTIKFSNKNTAANPTLNVNSLGAKTIVSESGTWSADSNWSAGQTFTLTYDGTNWIMSAALAQAAADAAASAATTASTAASNASTALSTANTASSNASTALSTANTASSNASTALSTANNAKTAAQNAATAAANAASAASAAQSTADTAKQLAENIKVGGRNLLKDADCTVATTYGIKATKDTEGWFKITGTSTATANTLLYPRWKYGNYTENDTIAKNGIYTITVEDESGILSNVFTVQVVVANHNETSGSTTHFYEGGVKTFDLTNKWLMRVTLFTNANSNGITYNGRIRVKLEKGNQSTDWTPAPEDVDADIANAYNLADDANTAAGNAATAAAQANTAITTINTDNVFSIIEKKTIRIEWYAVHGKADTTSTANASGSYQKALTAAGETDVATSTLTTAYTNLKNYLNTNKLYTQENTTGFNRTTLSTYFTAYYNAETALYDAIADYYAQQAQAAAEAIANKAQLLAECAQLVKDAYLMYRDTEFTLEKNGINVYNNTSGSTAVTITRAAANNLPNCSGYQLTVKTNGTASPGCGGIKWSWSARYNAVYIVIMKCKIPTGYYLDFVQNTVGTDYVKAWATTADGDGTWRDYVVYLKCGSSGDITTTGYIALRPQSGYSATSVTWYIASAAVFDCTATEWLNLAYKNSTDIRGGVVLTNVVQVQDNNNDVTAGMNGLNPNAVGKNPRFWAGGTYSDAVDAGAHSDEDTPSEEHILPILLTDQGYNSNIGIFKVLENAIAVMRSGQVIRISTDTYDNEKDNAPIAPVTRTLATNKQLDITTSDYNHATQTWNIGTFPKQASFDISIPSISIVANMYFSRVMYTTGNVTGSLYFTIEVLAGGKSVTILDTEIATTVSATSGGTYSFNKNQTFNTTAKTISNVSGSSAQYIQLKITGTITTTGSGGTITYSDSYVKTTAALTVTVSENQSCFILAKGGFACAQTSTKSLLYDAAAGTFDYNGTTFKINGRDFLNSKGQIVTTGSGYVQLSRIGQVVTCKLNIPKSNMSTSAIIPSGYRPTINFDVLCTTGNSSTAYLVTVGSNGSITSAALPNNTVAYGVVSYVTSDAYPS